MKTLTRLAGASVIGLTMISIVAAQEVAPTENHADAAKIKEAVDFANTNKKFAETSASHLDVNAAPRGIADSDPAAVAQVVALEQAVEKAFNTEYLTHPDSMLRFYVNSPDRSQFDLVTPGEYYGEDLRKLYNYIAPAFIGRLEFKEMKVYAKGDAGFVMMKQNYFGKTVGGEPIHWIIRQTDGVIKQNGAWKILHTHLSLPVDIKTWKADVLSTKTPLPWNRPKSDSK